MPIIMKNNVAYAGSYDNQVKQLKLAEYIELEKAGKTNSDTVYFIEDANEELAKNIAYDNTDSGLTATDMQNAIDEVFQSVSDGKKTVASAITDMGVTTASDATFETMATNIGKITTGIDTSDATATATKIASGYTAYAKGKKITGSATLAPYDLGNYLKGSSFTISEKTNNSSTANMIGKMIHWYHYHSASNYMKFTTKKFDITNYTTLNVSYVLPTNDYTSITVKLIDASNKSVTVFSGGGTGSKSVTVSSLTGDTYFEISSQGKSVDCYLSELYLSK